MDTHMPEMDGVEATRQIRTTESDGQRIPILAFTAAAMDWELERCRQAGVDGVLAKPVRRSELIAVLEQWAPGKAAPSREPGPVAR